MNPCIPLEFYSSTQFAKSDWEVDVDAENADQQYPVVPAGAYSRIKVLPLQVLLIQRVLENPDLVCDYELPSMIQDFLFQHFQEVGRLSALNLGTLAQNATEIDLSHTRNFSSSVWLPQLSSSPSLSYVTLSITVGIHILHLWSTNPDFNPNFNDSSYVADVFT
jgi:hypothetical protein